MITFMRIMTLSTALAVGTAFPANQSVAAVATQQEQGATEQTIKQALQTWISAIGSGKATNVTDLYAADAVLLPTLSAKVHNTPALRLEYFEKIAALKNLTVTLQEQQIRLLGNVAVDSGLYTFTHVKEGKSLSIPARFTFVYEKTPQGWVIVEHHSSKLPE
jgi:uncharacterized protein (TIGR02246 family)